MAENISSHDRQDRVVASQLEAIFAPSGIPFINGIL